MARSLLSKVQFKENLQPLLGGKSEIVFFVRLVALLERLKLFDYLFHVAIVLHSVRS